MTFNSTEEFIEKFNLQKYYEVIKLTDTKVGFSAKRAYPADISYKPSLTKAGEPNNVSVTWVTYLHPEETTKKLDPDRIPVSVRISTKDLYVSKHWDYNFEDPLSPTKESLEASDRTRKPLELISNDEFFYDHKRNTFVDNKGAPITGQDILDKIFREHCDTVHPLRGLPIRMKLSMQSVAYAICEFLIGKIKFTLKKVFGRTIEDEDTLSELQRGYKKTALKKLSTDSLEVLGYKAPKGIIILFCFLIALLSFFGSKSLYLQYIFDKEFLILAHSIFVLWLLDNIIPPILFNFMNGIIWLRAKVIRLKLKV